MNIQEAIAAGKKKHQEYRVKKVKRISDNMKYSDAPKLSVTNLFTLIDTYCDFYGLKTQHRITARLKVVAYIFPRRKLLRNLISHPQISMAHC